MNCSVRLRIVLRWTFSCVFNGEEALILDCEEISSDGTLLKSFGKRGGSCGEFQYPSGIAFDTLCNIVVADSTNHRAQVEW